MVVVPVVLVAMWRAFCRLDMIVVSVTVLPVPFVTFLLVPFVMLLLALREDAACGFYNSIFSGSGGNDSSGLGGDGACMKFLHCSLV